MFRVSNRSFFPRNPPDESWMVDTPYGDGQYAIKAVVDRRYAPPSRSATPVWQYKVRWLGFGKSSDTLTGGAGAWGRGWGAKARVPHAAYPPYCDSNGTRPVT